MKKHVIKVTEVCYEEIRRKLVALGDGGTIEERSDKRTIDMTGVVIETRGKQTSKSPA